MKIHDFARGDVLKRLAWNGDNREFVVNELLPALHPSKDVLQVLRWAYGYDGSDRSYEMESDGSTIVPDRFMMGIIKEPPGVGHDYLNRVHGQPKRQFDVNIEAGMIKLLPHITPDGHRWTALESCLWYRKCLVCFGYPTPMAWIRFFALATTHGWWWKR